MQGAAVALSPAVTCIFNGRSSRRVDFGARANVLKPIQYSGSSPSPLRHYSASRYGNFGHRSLVFYSTREDFKIRASSVPESAGEGSSSLEEAKPAGGEIAQTLLLGALFGLWYLFNIYFNIFNKQVTITDSIFPKILLFFLLTLKI